MEERPAPLVAPALSLAALALLFVRRLGQAGVPAELGQHGRRGGTPGKVRAPWVRARGLTFNLDFLIHFNFLS